MTEICSGIAEQFSKAGEQRLYILLLCDVIAKNNGLKKQYAAFKIE